MVGLPWGAWTPVLNDLHGKDSITFKPAVPKHRMPKSPIAVLCNRASNDYCLLCCIGLGLSERSDSRWLSAGCQSSSQQLHQTVWSCGCQLTLTVLPVFLLSCVPNQQVCTAHMNTLPEHIAVSNCSLTNLPVPGIPAGASRHQTCHHNLPAQHALQPSTAEHSRAQHGAQL